MNKLVSIVTDVRFIVAVITIAAGIYVNGKIEAVTDMLRTANVTLTSIQQIINVDPAKITTVGQTIKTSAEEVGAGVANGGVEVVDKLGTAWDNFKNRDSQK